MKHLSKLLLITGLFVATAPLFSHADPVKITEGSKVLFLPSHVSDKIPATVLQIFQNGQTKIVDDTEWHNVYIVPISELSPRVPCFANMCENQHVLVTFSLTGGHATAVITDMYAAGWVRLKFDAGYTGFEPISDLSK